jgi:hypothetical protein
MLPFLEGLQGGGRANLLAALLLVASGTLGIQASASGNNADDAYLDHLQGSWVMEGNYAGKPVRYRAEGQRVLRGAFLKLRMIDAASPPQYEAELFLGFDPKANDYIAHWLDNFGAAGARVVARGERQGEILTVTFPYAEGAFRDTFTWQPAAKSWSLLMESQRSDAAWKTTAKFTLTRPAPR